MNIFNHEHHVIYHNITRGLKIYFAFKKTNFYLSIQEINQLWKKNNLWDVSFDYRTRRISVLSVIKFHIISTFIIFFLAEVIIFFWIMFLHAESTYLREGDKVEKGIENRGMINRRWRNIWWQKKKKKKSWGWSVVAIRRPSVARYRHTNWSWRNRFVSYLYSTRIWFIRRRKIVEACNPGETIHFRVCLPHLIVINKVSPRGSYCESSTHSVHMRYLSDSGHNNFGNIISVVNSIFYSILIIFWYYYNSFNFLHLIWFETILILHSRIIQCLKINSKYSSKD